MNYRDSERAPTGLSAKLEFVGVFLLAAFGYTPASSYV